MHIRQYILKEKHTIALTLITIFFYQIHYVISIEKGIKQLAMF